MARTLFLNESVADGPNRFAFAGRSGFRRNRRSAISLRHAAERAAARCRLAREIASAVLAVPAEEIARPNRSIAETCQARHVAIYLAHVVFQVPLSAIGSNFGRDRTSVAYAIRRIEDARDEAGFEMLVTRMERLADACLDLASQGAFK